MIDVLLTSEYIKRPKAVAVPESYWQPGEGWRATIRSGEAAAIALALFPETLSAYPELGPMRDALYGDARPTDYATGVDIRLAWDLRGIDPFEYQQIDTGYLAAQLRRLGGAFLGWDRGLGKTLASIALARKMGARRVIVVCGNTMKDPVWGNELRQAWPEAEVTIIPNEKTKRERCINAITATPNGHLNEKGERNPQVFVIHYEALALIAGKNAQGKKGRGEGWKKLGTWDGIIFDESHRLANMRPKSKRNTQMGAAVMKARAQCSWALALTGTAIMNHPDDLFGQLHFLFPNTYKSRFRDFSDRFLDYVDTEHGEVCIGFKPERLQSLRDELGVFMVYRTKADELDLPERIIEDRYIELGAAQRRAYDELVEQWWTKLESGETVAATSPVAMLTKLRQVATGLDTAGTTMSDSAKLDYALALIEDDDPSNAYVVLSWYKIPVHSLADRLEAKGITSFVVDGDVPHEHRAERVAAFQRGERRVFLGTIATLGESVNLQRANRMILLDRSWNPAQNEQAMDRIYRIGTTERVVVTNLIAEDTVDQLRVQPVLASKEAIRRSVFGGEARVAA